jgi:hypothetical protein
MTIMNTFKHSFAAAALSLLMLSLLATAAQATGTPSGTTISNTATMNYTVGGVAQTAIGSSPTGNTSGAGTATTFVVDKKINLTVTANDATFVSVSPGATAAVTTFTVTNIGNDPQDFSLSSIQEASGVTLFGGTDNFNATSCSQFVESGGTAGYQAAQDTATVIASLASGASSTVYVVCSIPTAQANGDVAVIGLLATAKVAGSNGATALTQTTGANTAGVDTVFADDAGTDDAVRDAAFSARDAYKVSASTLTVTKTAAPLCDPYNATTNPKEIPGAIVRYTITVSNAAGAGASAILTTMTDAPSTNVTTDPNFVTGAGGTAGCSSSAGTPSKATGAGFQVQSSAAGRALGGTGGTGYFTTANDGDGADLNAGTITINFALALPAGGSYAAGELKAGETATVLYNITVN